MSGSCAVTLKQSTADEQPPELMSSRCIRIDCPPVGNDGWEKVMQQALDSLLILSNHDFCFLHQCKLVSCGELLKGSKLCKVWRQVGFPKAQIALDVQDLHVQGSIWDCKGLMTKTVHQAHHRSSMLQICPTAQTSAVLSYLVRRRVAHTVRTAVRSQDPQRFPMLMLQSPSMEATWPARPSNAKEEAVRRVQGGGPDVLGEPLTLALCSSLCASFRSGLTSFSASSSRAPEDSAQQLLYSIQHQAEVPHPAQRATRIGGASLDMPCLAGDSEAEEMLLAFLQPTA